MGKIEQRLTSIGGMAAADRRIVRATAQRNAFMAQLAVLTLAAVVTLAAVAGIMRNGGNGDLIAGKAATYRYLQVDGAGNWQEADYGLTVDDCVALVEAGRAGDSCERY